MQPPRVIRDQPGGHCALRAGDTVVAIGVLLNLLRLSFNELQLLAYALLTYRALGANLEAAMNIHCDFIASDAPNCMGVLGGDPGRPSGGSGHWRAWMLRDEDLASSGA